MAQELSELFDTLKSELKSNNKTYADIANTLNLAEATIKQNFASENMRMDRFERICQDVLAIDMAELHRRMEARVQHVDALTEDQERLLTNNPELFVVAICVLNSWTREEIVSIYDIDNNQCDRHLYELEKFKLIKLLPDSRIRLLINKNFDWLPNGPIARFFKKEIEPEFLNSTFDKHDQTRVFKTGMLTNASIQKLMREINRLIANFQQLNETDCQLELSSRIGTSILVAARPYEMDAFAKMRRSS